MKIVSVACIAAGSILLSGCQEEARRPAVSLEQARQVTADFQGQAFVAPPRTISDITAILRQYQPDPARIAALRDSAVAAIPDGAPAERYAALVARAAARAEIGLAKEQIADLQQAIQIAEQSGIDATRAYQQVQIAESFAGNSRRALEYAERRLAASLAAERRGGILGGHAAVGYFKAFTGDLGGAERSVAAARAMLSDQGLTRFPGYRAMLPDWESTIQRANLEILSAQGRYREAEQEARAALANAERFNDAEARRFVPDLPLGSRDAQINQSTMRIGQTLMRQGRGVEAEAEFRKVLVRTLQSVGRYHPRTASVTMALTNSILEQGRYAEAMQLADVALDIYSQIGVPTGSRFVASAHAVRAIALNQRGEHAAAVEAWSAARAVFANDVDERHRWVESRPAYVRALIRAGRLDEALPVARRVADERRQRLGDRSDQTAEARGFIAAVLAARGQTEQALAEFRAAIPILLQSSRQTEDEGGASARDDRIQFIFESYIRLLATQERARTADFDPAAEAFRVADAARAQGVQRALAASAARANLGDPVLADLARREQDARTQIGAQFALLSNIMAAPADQQDPAAVRALRERIDRLRDARAALREEIERRFPDYANLIDPRPSTVAQVQAQLRPGEALVSIYVGVDRTFVWAVPRSGPVAFAAADLGERQVAAAVANLRKALDPNAATLGDIPTYDVALAHRLYAALVAPVKAGLQGATDLLIVPDKALGQLPFGLLVTAPAELPQDGAGSLFSGYRRVPFLIREAAVTQLPSVSALGTLRRTGQNVAGRQPFIGFGDPWFNADQAREAQAEVRVAAASGQVQTRGRPLVRRNAPTTQNVDSAELGALPRLPDTAEEVRAVALALRADPNADVLLGARASERAVKTSDLSRRRVVMFATHGLVPGDLNGLTQPALALTAPALAGTPGDDGLLTMEEVLGLRLNADWVVLSACNTATGEGAGAEAVSGLGRAFFYAGTRALLVTNWPVETTSARELTTDLFRRQAENAGLGRAQAIRQAMIALIDGDGFVEQGKTVFSYAHPIFWAPFSVVGDGGGANAGT